MPTRSEPVYGLLAVLACSALAACAGAAPAVGQQAVAPLASGAGEQARPEQLVPAPSAGQPAPAEQPLATRQAPEAPTAVPASPRPTNGVRAEHAASAKAGDANAATLDLLAFHERVREMSAGELARQAARLSDAPASAAGALALAVVLAQTHNPGDLARALALIEPLARSTDPATAPWQPIARWLAARYAEQRRLEEQIERQAQQLREQQRRLDQLAEKLAALKAIERSLGRSPSPLLPPLRPPPLRAVPK